MNELIVDLNISADEYLRLYRGEVESVVARTLDGRTVRFPANALRGFVTRNGIRGRYRIRYGADGRLIDIQRL
ncbi:hypothetical protein GCM10011352_21890 [Marinobacterium zhoushanense]|uniref:DUF2835 family protein n=1 Tax=Marinobacterium zhoushanense TaxID=1679163 RepID=A0ABQ1KCB3_9GAMM|nr:DUF2835 domain-containing protein [Marinobacterium zhoushanense]GGB95420.1 hypothetical protein GCM10011352_21890 [Marinobacterium zhoushanense]